MIMALPQAKESDFIFVVERTFNASRERVWKAWTDKDQVSKWFGPKGCTILKMEVDLRAGGKCSYGMKFGEMGTMWGQWAYGSEGARETGRHRFFHR
jgi:uncharacterized protein YndB with AHSA1/START domain